MASPSGEATLRRRRGGNSDTSTRNGRNEGSQATQNNADNRNPGAGPQTQGQGRQQPNAQNAFRQFLFRAVLMYFMYQYYMKPKTQQANEASQQNKAASNAAVGGGAIPSILSNSSSMKGVNDWLSKMGVVQTPQPAYFSKALSCHWADQTSFDVSVFFSTDSKFDFRQAASLAPSEFIWTLSSLTYSTNERNYHSKNITVPVPRVVSHENSTWYAHVFVVKGRLWDVARIGAVSDEAITEHVLYARHELITWIDVNIKNQGKHLLSSHVDEATNEADDSAKGENVEKSEETPQPQCKPDDATCEQSKTNVEEDMGKKDANVTVRYDQVWKPTLPIVLVIGLGKLTLSQLPPSASEKFKVSEKYQTYYPPMHVEEFWHIRDSLQLMNESVSEISLEFSFKPISVYKWSLYRQFEDMWRKQIALGTLGRGEMDEMKRMFVETNPVLLATTAVVSMAHSILEGLAFKNDISHWRNIKSMEGVSVRSMIWKIVMELIIFLYLWDHDTSWMIIIGNAVGLVIEVWKLCKAVKFEKFGQGRLLGFIPWFIVSNHESYSKKTKEYDDQAMKYMGYIVYPLVIGYALYSLKYDTHKSWYSWIVNSLVGAVYAFGFIMMFPQIFINYKLKSVAHIPMKAMMYKTLNTIIDDLFSFIIKMPWLHRLACFRDDIVFLILLYQRYLYPTDYSRVNEFGQQFDEKGEIASSASASTADDSVATEDKRKPDNGEPPSTATNAATEESAQSKSTSSDKEVDDTSDEPKNDKSDVAGEAGDEVSSELDTDGATSSSAETKE